MKLSTIDERNKDFFGIFFDKWPTKHEARPKPIGSRDIISPI